MAYVPRFKTEAEASTAFDKGEATNKELQEAGEFQTFEQQQRSLNERLALGETGAVARTGASFSAGDVNVHAKFFGDDAQSQFIEYEGGGVKFATPEEIAGLTGTGKPVNASGPNETSTGQLKLTAAEGKTIARSGQTIKNPKTGVDEQANPGEILIEYTDGTVERRKVSDIGTPGETKAIGEFGQTADELGITRQTEIKGGEGTEVTRMPQTARQALDAAQTAEEKDKVLVAEGLQSTSELELIGKSYQDRVAGAGNVFYQDPTTREILERPEALQELAKPSTSPTVAAERSDIPTTFKSVFGRDPSPEELKYWQGRKDKSGAALIGAMQFAKQQGAAIGAQPGSDIADPIEAAKAKANASQQNVASALKEAGVTSGSSDKKAIKATLDALKPPGAESLKEFTQDQLAASQFQEATNDLNQSKAALRQMDTDYLSNLSDAERTPGLSMGAIRRNQTELDVAYNRARRDLVQEVQANTDIVQSQAAIMGMMVDAFKFDTQQAQVEYQNRYNKARDMYDIVSTEERDAFNVSQKLQDNQRANLSVVTSMLQSGNLQYDQLSGDQKAQISYMEQQVGLPAGFTSFVSTIAKDPEVTIGASITGADGTVITPVYTVDPTTGTIKTTHITQPIKERVPAGGTPKATPEEKEGVAFIEDTEGLVEKMIGGDYDWQQAWDTLNFKYPTASVETIDNALGLSNRDKYNK